MFHETILGYCTVASSPDERIEEKAVVIAGRATSVVAAEIFLLGALAVDKVTRRRRRDELEIGGVLRDGGVLGAQLDVARILQRRRAGTGATVARALFVGGDDSSEYEPNALCLCLFRRGLLGEVFSMSKKEHSLWYSSRHKSLLVGFLFALRFSRREDIIVVLERNTNNNNI